MARKYAQDDFRIRPTPAVPGSGEIPLYESTLIENSNGDFEYIIKNESVSYNPYICRIGRGFCVNKETEISYYVIPKILWTTFDSLRDKLIQKDVIKVEVDGPMHAFILIKSDQFCESKGKLYDFESRQCLVLENGDVYSFQQSENMSNDPIFTNHIRDAIRGVVRRGDRTIDGNKTSVAFKIFNYNELSITNSVENRTREIAIMQYINKQLDELLGVGENSETNVSLRRIIEEGSRYLMRLIDVFHDGHVIYMVLPLVSGGDMLDALKYFGRPENLSSSLELFEKILKGVYVLHRCNIAHFDISMENVMLDMDHRTPGSITNSDDIRRCRPIIIDFGASIIQEIDENGPIGRKYYLIPCRRAGKPSCLPIESFEWRRPVLPISFDSWQLGVLLFTMVMGMRPFNAKDGQEARNNWYRNVHCKRHNSLIESKPFFMNNFPNYLELLKKLLDSDWLNRILLHELEQFSASS